MRKSQEFPGRVGIPLNIELNVSLDACWRKPSELEVGAWNFDKPEPMFAWFESVSSAQSVVAFVKACGLT
jgi:hypothetical protein